MEVGELNINMRPSGEINGGHGPALVGRLAAAWKLSRIVTARAAAGSSHRWPTLNELVRNFAAGTVTTVANPNLLPERARSIEAGLDATKGQFQISVTGCRSIVRDAARDDYKFSSLVLAIVKSAPFQTRTKLQKPQL